MARRSFGRGRRTPGRRPARGERYGDYDDYGDEERPRRKAAPRPDYTPHNVIGGVAGLLVVLLANFLVTRDDVRDRRRSSRSRSGSSRSRSTTRRSAVPAPRTSSPPRSGDPEAAQARVSTKEKLKNAVQRAYEGGGDGMYRLMYTEGMPDELKDLSRQIMSFGSGKYKITRIEIYAFSEHKPRGDYPGTFQGRKLKWLFQPTHWIVLETTDPSPPEGTSMSMKLSLPVGEHEGSWWIVGGTYR